VSLGLCRLQDQYANSIVFLNTSSTQSQIKIKIIPSISEQNIKILEIKLVRAIQYLYNYKMLQREM
jgi:hypothetical protein